MPSLENDLHRYFDAIAERVQDGLEESESPPRSNGRTLWPVLAVAALVVVVVGVAITVNAASNDDAQVTTDPDAGTSNMLVPFPVVDTDTLQIDNVYRLEEADSDWGGRRSHEQSTDVTVFHSPASDEPIVVSSGVPRESEPLVDRGDDVTGRPAYDFSEGDDASFQLIGVPQDAPAVVVLDPDGLLIVAQHGADSTRLREIAAGVDVTPGGKTEVDPALGLTEIGALEAPWATPAGTVIPVFVEDYDDTNYTGPVEVAMRGISEAEATALLALANRDPNSSLRTAASVDLTGAAEPEEVDVAGHQGTLATIASGFRALIVPDPGFVIFSNGSTPIFRFLTTAEFVSLGEGVEMLTAEKFDERAEPIHEAALERAIASVEGSEHSRLVWSSRPGERSFLALLDYGPPQVQRQLNLERLELWNGAVVHTQIALMPGGDGAKKVGIGQAPPYSADGFTKVIGGIAPAGTATVEATVHDSTVVADVIETGVAEAPVIFISSVPGLWQSSGGEYITATAKAADGTVLAEYTNRDP